VLGDFYKKAPMGLNIKSLPMYLADKAMGGITKATGNFAGDDALKFIFSDINHRKMAVDAMKGAAHLGMASAISGAPIYDLSLESFAEKRAPAALSGAIFGAGNSIVANMFGKSGFVDFAKDRFPVGSPEFNSYINKGLTLTEIEAKRQLANKAARSITSAIAFGMPSTFAGAPIESQIYDYVTNAFFGWREPPTHVKEAMGFIQKTTEGSKMGLYSLYNHKDMEGYKSLSDYAKEEVDSFVDVEAGRLINHAGKLYSDLEITLSDSFADIVDKAMRAKNENRLTDEEYATVISSYRVLQVASNPDATEADVDRAIDESIVMGKSILDDTYNPGDINSYQSNIGVLRQFYTISDALRESGGVWEAQGLGYYAKNGIDDFIDFVAQSKKSAVAKRSDVYRSISDIFMKDGKFVDTIANREAFYESVINLVGDGKDVKTIADIPATVKDELNRSIVKLAGSVEYPVYRYNEDTRLPELVEEYDKYGNRNSKFIAGESNAYAVTNGNIRIVKERVTPDEKNGGVKIRPLWDEEGYDDDVVFFTYDMYNTPWGGTREGRASMHHVPFMGEKASSLYVFRPPIIEDPNEAYTFAKEVLKVMGENMEAVTDPKAKERWQDHINGYKNEVQKWIRMLTSAGVDENTARSSYHHVYLENLLDKYMLNKGEPRDDQPKELMPWFNIREALNDPQRRQDLIIDITSSLIGDIEGGKSVVFTADQFNKRGQMYGTKFLKVPGSMVKEKFGTDQYKVAITGLIPDPKDPFVKALYGNETTYVNSQDRELAYDAQFDGGTFVSKRLYDIIVETMGGDGSAGHFKGSQLSGEIASDGTIGTYMTKEALFVANDRLQKLMDEAGIDILVNTKGAKSWGEREVVPFEYQKNELGDTFAMGFNPEALRNASFSVPVSHLRFSFQINKEQALHDQRLVKQSMSNISADTPLGRQAQADLFDAFIKPVIEGSKEYPRLSEQIRVAEETYGSDSEEYFEAVELLNVDDIPLAERQRIINDPEPHELPLFKKIVDDMLDLDENDIVALADTMNSDQMTNSIEGLAKASGSGRRLLKIMGDVLDPDTILMPGIKDIFDAVAKNYFMYSVLSPKLKGSAKIPFFVHDPLGNTGLDGNHISVSPGEVYFAKGMQDYKVYYEGKLTPLKEVWKLMQDGKIDGYDIFSARVPMGSKSDGRVLAFKGFVDREGYGFIVHPEDYAKMLSLIHIS